MSLNRDLYFSEEFEANELELLDFLESILTEKGCLFLGFKYYYISINDLDNIVNREIRKINKILVKKGMFMEDLAEAENYKYIKAHASLENDFWYSGYEPQLYKEPKTLWVKVTGRDELEKLLGINIHFVCVVSRSKDEFQPELLIRCAETVDDDGADKDMLIFEDIKEET